jgi:ferrous iron transport protein A
MALSKANLTTPLPIGYAAAHMQPAPLTLSELAIGETATISGYARGDRGLRNRLLALGLTRGTQISLVRAGMTGCPIEVRARGASLVLRRTEAAALHVERQQGVR